MCFELYVHLFSVLIRVFTLTGNLHRDQTDKSVNISILQNLSSEKVMKMNEILKRRGKVHGFREL